jgi:hypothetical protein
MKRVLVKGRKDIKNGTKSMSIIQRTDEKDNSTCIRKSFYYNVSKTDISTQIAQAPQIYIVKTIDTKKKIEGFNFQVQGSFYMTVDRSILKVEFHHVLNIRIKWKTNNFSPKKSEVLT